MSGTVEGGRKAAKTNLERHGKDFFRNIGQKGGHNSRKGGFACDKVGKDGLTGPERARIVGAKGGRVSVRGSVMDDIWARHKKEIVMAYQSGKSLTAIAKILGVEW